MSDLVDENSPPRRGRNRRLAVILSCTLLAVLTVVAYFWLFDKPGIQVTVQNTGSQPIRSVILVVTGNTYNVGDIPPNGTAQATVKCTGDSHLEIEFRNEDGTTTRLDAGGFFQAGYRGTIRVSIKDGEIQENRQDIEWRAS